MMDGMAAMMMFWSVFSLVVLALAVVGGVWVARALSHREADRTSLPEAQPPGLGAAEAELRRRYAAGEITREEYLQGKVDLE